MKEWLIKWFGPLGQFISVLFKQAVQQELKLILPIAAEAVRKVAADPSIVENALKRQAAFDIIGEEIGKAQLNVGMSLVNLAIELAVQEMKNTK